jgi:hypothetical protein
MELKKLFVSKTEKVTWGWRRFHNEVLYNLGKCPICRCHGSQRDSNRLSVDHTTGALKPLILSECVFFFQKRAFKNSSVCFHVETISSIAVTAFNGTFKCNIRNLSVQLQASYSTPVVTADRFQTPQKRFSLETKIDLMINDLRSRGNRREKSVRPNQNHQSLLKLMWSSSTHGLKVHVPECTKGSTVRFIKIATFSQMICTSVLFLQTIRGIVVLHCPGRPFV